jgi:4,5-DOPA dioxygenase extradiol
MRLPTLFISHGSPLLALDTGKPGAAWCKLFAELPKPRAVLMVSAHWGTDIATVSTATQPQTIHDFYGFPPAMYAIQYPAPGAPAVSQHAAALLRAAGLPVALAPDYGLDHGAWVPLRVVYPQADVPVFQLSVQPQKNPAHHLRVGAALSALMDENVLIIGSGSLTHNLRDLAPPDSTAAPAYVTAFQQWMHDRLQAHDSAALADYRRRAPDAVRAHPTDEHLLPLFVALGAAGENAASTRHFADITHGALAMDVYEFTAAAAALAA